MRIIVHCLHYGIVIQGPVQIMVILIKLKHTQLGFLLLSTLLFTLHPILLYLPGLYNCVLINLVIVVDSILFDHIKIQSKLIDSTGTLRLLIICRDPFLKYFEPRISDDCWDR